MGLFQGFVWSWIFSIDFLLHPRWSPPCTESTEHREVFPLCSSPLHRLGVRCPQRFLCWEIVPQGADMAGGENIKR